MSNARVALVTGIVVEKLLPKGEVDGPVGAAVLGRALGRLGHEVDLLVEEEMDDVAKMLIGKLGCDANVVHTTNRSPEDLARWADHYDVAVTVEKLGRNREGVRHSVMGSPLAKTGDYYIDDFIEAMTDKGKLTVGIGDGGNEIGFGKICDDVRGMVAFGADCGCPCGGGTATTTATRYLFPAAISNYGAYALTAGPSPSERASPSCWSTERRCASSSRVAWPSAASTAAPWTPTSSATTGCRSTR